MKTTYDTIIVGSSPGSLLEALVAQRQGNRVCVIDRSRPCGGAWSVQEVFGIEGVESGPHFFQSDADLDFLKDDIEFQLCDVPRTAWKVRIRGVKLQLRDRWAKLLVASLLLAGSLFGKSRRSFEHVRDDRATRFRGAFRQIWFHLFRYAESTRYFSGGCRRFLESAMCRAKQEGVEFVQADISGVSDHGLHLCLCTPDGSEFYCKQLWITRRTTLNYFESKDDRIQFETIRVYRNQVHLRVVSSRPISFYLYRFIGLGYFALVNLSKIGNVRAGDDSVVLCATRSDMSQPTYTDADGCNRVLQEFKTMGVLPDDCRLIESESSVYEDNRMSDEAYIQIEEQSDYRVRVIGDIDFAEWARDLQTRWILSRTVL